MLAACRKCFRMQRKGTCTARSFDFRPRKRGARSVPWSSGVSKAGVNISRPTSGAGSNPPIQKIVQPTVIQPRPRSTEDGQTVLPVLPKASQRKSTLSSAPPLAEAGGAGRGFAGSQSNRSTTTNKFVVASPTSKLVAGPCLGPTTTIESLFGSDC